MLFKEYGDVARRRFVAGRLCTVGMTVLNFGGNATDLHNFG